MNTGTTWNRWLSIEHALNVVHCLNSVGSTNGKLALTGDQQRLIPGEVLQYWEGTIENLRAIDEVPRGSYMLIEQGATVALAVRSASGKGVIVIGECTAKKFGDTARAIQQALGASVHAK